MTPQTAAGRRLVTKLDAVGASPLSGVSFPEAEDDVADIETEARAAALDEAIAAVGGMRSDQDHDADYEDVVLSQVAAVLEALRGTR